MGVSLFATYSDNCCIGNYRKQSYWKVIFSWPASASEEKRIPLPLVVKSKCDKVPDSHHIVVLADEANGALELSQPACQSRQTDQWKKARQPSWVRCQCKDFGLGKSLISRLYRCKESFKFLRTCCRMTCVNSQFPIVNSFTIISSNALTF